MRSVHSTRVVLVLFALMVLASATGSLAQASDTLGLTLQVGAIGAVAPDGMVGPELSLRLVPLHGTTESGAPTYLWLDVAATSDDFQTWGLVTGLSADLQAINALSLGLAERGGFGRDWTRDLWVLYVSRSFSVLFK